MGDVKKDDAAGSGESELRGEELEGAGNTRAVRNRPAKDRNPDAVVRLDGEEDTLYTDDLELEDVPPLADTTRDGLR